MKYLFILGVVILVGCAAQDILIGQRKRDHSMFSVDGQIVLYNKRPIAKYQAKTYSLDNNELVEEYNLLLLDNQINNKQIIGDLIDFVSERHSNAEVEIEIDSYNSVFKL